MIAVLVIPAQEFIARIGRRFGACGGVCHIGDRGHGDLAAHSVRLKAAVGLLGLGNELNRVGCFKAGVVGGVPGGGVADGRTVIDQHGVGNLVACGIIPAHKLVAGASGGGGADRHTRRVNVFIPSEGTDLVVRGVLPRVAVFDLTDIGLGDAAGEAGVVGVDALLGLHIGVGGVCGDQISAGVIPALKGEAVLCGSCCCDGLIGFGVVGFSAVGVISGIVIGIGFVGDAGDLDRAAVGGIRVVRAAAHLRDKRLPPAPLGYHGKTFVVIGVGSFFPVIFPGYTINLITRFIHCFRQ